MLYVQDFINRSLTMTGVLAVLALILLADHVPHSKGQPTIGGRHELSEERLINWLMGTYVKEARPVLKHSDAVAVSVKFSFVRIEDLDEASDTFTSSLFIVQMWNDPRLRWNMSEYNGLQTVRLPASKLWIPDLVLYNVAYKTPPQSLYEETVTVTSDGNVVWVPMLTLYSTCPMDLTDFPYDIQTCNLVFGSWMHTSWEMNITFISNKSEMDIVLNEEDTSYPVHQHPQWGLVDNKARAKLTLKKYECCQQPFTLITISVQLHRKPQFYHHLTVAPAAVLGFLVPIIYLVPARSQDKTTFGLLLLLALMLLMTILQQAIPFSHGSLPKIYIIRAARKAHWPAPTLLKSKLYGTQADLDNTIGFIKATGLKFSDRKIKEGRRRERNFHSSGIALGSFYLGTMVLTCASIFASVAVANLSVRGARRKPLPAWIHAIFLGRRSLRYFLCIGNYGPVENLYASELHSVGTSDVGLQEVEGVEKQLLQNLEGANCDKNVVQIAKYVKFIVGKMAADISYRNINQDWEELGRVIDRCLFLVFFVLYIFTASTLL